MTGVKTIDQQARDSILAAFNRFDTGFNAQEGNCNISLPQLSGRLHRTYILNKTIVTDSRGNAKKYVVQRLSLTPFDLKAVEHMLQMLEIAQELAETKGAFDRRAILEGWTKVKYYNVERGAAKEISGIQVGQKILYEHDKHGNPFAAWRVMEFVEGGIYDKLSDIGKDARETRSGRQSQLKAAELLGEALAKFAILMNFMPEDAQFMDTLPGFHNTKGYVKEVDNLLVGEKVPVRPGKDTPLAKMVDGLLDGRYQNGKYATRVTRMIEIFQSTCSLADAFEDLPPNLRRAIAHGDLKVNNVIWATDETGCPECVKCFIDLDTIGIYTALDDFGDAARSIINVLGENIWREGKTLAEVVLDQEVLEKLVKGYMKGMMNFYGRLNLEELETCLYRAVAVYFFQLGTRFFKAFISELDQPDEGDSERHFVYFIKRSDGDPEDTNLRLAEIQYTGLIKFLKEFGEAVKLDELNINLDDLPEPLGWKRNIA